MVLCACCVNLHARVDVSKRHMSSRLFARFIWSNWCVFSVFVTVICIWKCFFLFKKIPEKISIIQIYQICSLFFGRERAIGHQTRNVSSQLRTGERTAALSQMDSGALAWANARLGWGHSGSLYSSRGKKKRLLFFGIWHYAERVPWVTILCDVF